MTNEIIVLKHNNKICGYYQTKIDAEIFINSCIACKFIKNIDKIELEYYQLNSYILNKKETLSFKNSIKPKINNKIMYEDFSDSDITSIVSKNDFNINAQILDNDTDSEKSLAIKSESEDSFTLDAEAFLKKKKEERNYKQNIIDLGQQKSDVLSHINKLKLQKQQIIEKKTKYDYDLQLYEKFKQIKKDDFSFNIPLMFKDKYFLFEKLEKNNDLSFDAFNENYFEPQIETQYEDMFANEPHSYKLPKPEDFKSDDLNTLLSAAF